MLDKQIEQRFANQAKSKTFRNIIKEFSLDKKKVLDIGCSYGEHLAHFGKQSTGITIVQEEVDYGRQKGLDVRYGNIEEDFGLAGQYDVIFANNILEHLYSPHAFLHKTRKYLKSDGILILGVPCVPAARYLLRIPKFRGSLAKAHINFFTKFTLEKTAERSGWAILETRGFHFTNKFIDKCLNPVYPHFYVIAKPDPAFAYHEKRKKELAGYKDIDISDK